MDDEYEDDPYWCAECGEAMSPAARMFYGSTCADCRADVEPHSDVEVRCHWCSHVKKAFTTCCRVSDCL